MTIPISFTHRKTYTVKGDILTRLQSVLSLKKSYALVDSDQAENEQNIQFYFEDEIRGCDERLLLKFLIKGGVITETSLSIHSEKTDLNEYDLKNYIRDIYLEILTDEHHGSLEKFTIRTYARYFNSTSIKGEYKVYFGTWILIKPFQAPHKQEPLSEQILLYDIEVQAVNILQARSKAFNLTRDLNACLSVILDVGFEMINSQFNWFVIKKEDQFGLFRYRTGFYDNELEFVVKDNLNGLKSIHDKDDIENAMSGRIQMKVVDDITSPEKSDKPWFVYDATTKPNLEKTLKQHTLKQNKSEHSKYTDEIGKHNHLPNLEILMPRCIRKYFKGIHQLDQGIKDAFIACARLYNISLATDRSEPTASASYKVCAIEALALSEKASFSQFMETYCGDDLDKNLSDYFYAMRSSHFHAGKFYFNENATSLILEFDEIMREKTDEYFSFYRLIRTALVNWLENTLELKD